MGGTSLLTAVLLFRLVFAPGRGGGRPMAAFSVHHPAAIAAMVMAGVGLALLLAGLRIAGIDPSALDRRPPPSFGRGAAVTPEPGPPPPPLRGPPPP